MVFDVSSTSNACYGNSCVNIIDDQKNQQYKQRSNDAIQQNLVIDNSNNNYNNNDNGSKNVITKEEEVDSSEGPLTILTISNLSLYYDGPKFVGLKNLGNTCYINSTIQSLYGLNKLRKYLLNYNCQSRNDPHRIQLLLSKLFNQMYQMGNEPLSKNSFQIIKPDDFVREFCKLKPQFVRNEQHDAQEFLTILLDLIHQEANNIKKNKKTNFSPKNSIEAWKHHLNYIDNSFYSQLFVGQIESTLECSTCNHSSLSWNSFWQLNLHLKDENKENNINDNDNQQTLSIEHCIKDYMAWETLNDSAFCEKCKKKQKSRKRLTICRSPHYLIVHLKRFTHTGSKISKKVDINQSLKLCNKKYSLFSCILHRGTETTGHYQTLLRPYYQSWILLDDEQILNDIQNDNVKYLLQNYSYICIYRAIVNKICVMNE